MLPLGNGLTIGGVMAFDSDIANAGSAIELDRLCTQEYRNDVTAAVQKVEFDLSDVALRMRIVEAIAVNYMKPTTGYLPDTIMDDTTKDTARLRAAVTAVLELVKNG